MIVRFNNNYLEALYEGEPVKGKPKYNIEVIEKFRKSIKKMAAISSIKELYQYKGLNFEALNGDLSGFYSVRVDYHYRLILSLEKEEISIQDILIVEDLTNHYQ